MPRKLFICSSENPYHITARSHNKVMWPIPIEAVWEIMSLYLNFMHRSTDARVHSFVLMKNHIHLVASFPKANLSNAMTYFMGETSRRISKAAGHINQIYGSRSYRSEITNYHHYMNVYKYVYRNPVEADISTRAEEYSFSSLNRLLGGGNIDFPIAEDTLLFNGKAYLETLNWINMTPPREHYEMMRKALKRKVFRLAKQDKKPNELDLNLY